MNMNDKEIIKALECCSERDIDESNEGICCSCSLITDGNCTCTLAKYALDLINRLQAQNEVYETCNARKDETIKSLERRLKKLQMQFDDISKMYSEIKAEAYKEFAEKLHEELRMYGQKDKFDKAKFLIAVDNLLKELVGDSQ